MDRFFNMDNKFFTFMSRVADLIILNILCIVCCIPIVTIGPSISAMFYVTMKMVRNEESYIVRGFFKSFKQNLKQGIVINLIMLAAGVLLAIDISICRSTPGTIGKFLCIVYDDPGRLPDDLHVHLPGTCEILQYHQEHLYQRIFDVHPPSSYTALMILSLLHRSCILYSKRPAQSMVILLLVLIGFSGIAYINSHFFVKIFDKYIPEETSDRILTV